MLLQFLVNADSYGPSKCTAFAFSCRLDGKKPLRPIAMAAMIDPSQKRHQFERSRILEDHLSLNHMPIVFLQYLESNRMIKHENFT